MLKAFNFMFKDNMIWKKFLQIYGVMLLSSFVFLLSVFVSIPIMALSGPMSVLGVGLVVIFGIILAGIFYCLYYGYFASCVRAISIQEENIVLPFVEFWKNVKTGFKLNIAMFLFFAPWLLVFLIALTLGYIIKIKLFQILAITFLIVLVVVYFIVIICSFTGFNWIFAHTENIESFLQFKKLKEIINYNQNQYILCVALLFIVQAIFGLLSEIAQGKIAIIYIIVTFLTIPYVMYVTAYITAKSISKEAIKDVKSLLPIKKLKF